MKKLLVMILVLVQLDFKMCFMHRSYYHYHHYHIPDTRSEVTGYTKTRYRKCTGNDISSSTVNSLQDCAGKCNSSVTCVAFYYKRYKSYSTQINCVLKKNCPTKTSQYSYDTYERINMPGCTFTEVNGYALYGHNKKTFLESSIEYCKQQCIDNLDWCKSADYNRNKKICFLSTETRDTIPAYFGKYNGSTYIHRSCGSHISTWTPQGELQSKPELVNEGGTCFMRYGPFGGNGGHAFSDKSLIPHGRITALHFNTNGRLVCLAVTYGYIKGRCHGGTSGIQYTTVNLDSDEYITGMKGLIEGTDPQYQVISQLTFISNKRTIGPYGATRGSSTFSINSDGRKLAYISGKNGIYLDSTDLYFYC